MKGCECEFLIFLAQNKNMPDCEVEDWDMSLGRALIDTDPLAAHHAKPYLMKKTKYLSPQLQYIREEVI